MANPADAPVMPKELDPEMKKVFMHIQANKPRYIETLREAVSIRSVSALPEARAEVVRMVKWTAQKLTDIGVTVELRKIGEQTTCEGEVIPLPPVIFGHIGQDPSKKTVLIYGHLDVQPAKIEDGWDTEPFSLTEFDGKMFGRGATDDKGPVLGWIHAIEAYHQSRVEIPVNIKFCLEAMEESGSEGLEALLRCSADSFLADIDFVCISDNYWLGRDHPCLTYGLRGLCYFFVEVECGSKDLHSGVFGGSVVEAMPDLIFLMNSLVDADGKILVPGLTDEVAPLTQEEADTYKALKFDNEEFRLDAGVHKLRHPEDFTKTLMSRWRYPSLSIHGIQGCFSDPGAKTVIPRKVIGKFSVRLVPDQTVETVERTVTDHLTRKFAERNSPNKLLVYMADDGCMHWVGVTNDKNYEAAKQATQNVYGVQPDLIREGGFIRHVIILQEATKKNVLLLPMGASDDGAHSQNEKLDIRNYIEGTKLMASYLFELGKIKDAA